ncbi:MULTISPECIES: thiamine pyrophosphate-dependent enzyme [unclassified Serratia (in: enterobacteria)]|uniref:thiamine pyrophosphate-dependent enzyme n=1 Tax=unclassified Serratia (in: enterobacteria) TaxID=2647522 RepID=UPI00307619E9
MTTKKVADIIIEVLEDAGVKHCYGIVGDTLNHVTDAMSRSSIEWGHVRHEEVAAFAAGAESYVSGRLTACAGSCGPGSLHFINGVYEAQRNKAPMVLIASQIVTAQMASEFPQEVDFKSVYQSCSVYCETIINPTTARRIMTQACQAALNKRGVAVVVVPADISQSHVKEELLFSVHHPAPVLLPSENELREIASLLNQGKKIGIYAGAGCEGAHDLLVNLARKLNAPIAHTSRAKDFVEYDNPFNMGMTGMLGVKSGFNMLNNCETLLLLGADFAWSQFYPNNAKIVQIDRDGCHLGRRHPIELGVVGDVIPTLSALLPLLEQNEDDQFLQVCLKHRQNALEIQAREEHSGKGPLIHPQHLAHLVNKYAADDALFTADGGSAMVWLLRHIRSNGQRRTLTSLLHGTMANAMPQALGLQKAYPGRQVISLSGDGGLSMLMGDMMTAVQENLPIKIIVLNNKSLNFVELEQKTEGLLDNYTYLQNPDFAKVAEAIGFYGQKVAQLAELDSAIQAFLCHPGPALLDVHTNLTELVMPPTVGVSQVAGMALYAAKATIHGRVKDVEELIVNNFLK